MALLVHYTVHTSPIFAYGGSSEPSSPPHDSLAESVTPKRNPKPREYPPNPAPNVPDDPDSDPSLSYSSFSEPSDSSNYKYYKLMRRAKKKENKHGSKTCFDEPIKSAQILQPG